MNTHDPFGVREGTDAPSCGNCVIRYALRITDEFGHCMFKREQRHRDAEPCEDFFGLTELRKPMYGKTQKCTN